VQAKGSALISWKKIARPKNQGGLGVLNIETQNKALLLKNLDKFYNNHDIPWVKLVKGLIMNMELYLVLLWRVPYGAHLKLIDIYKGMAKCNLGDGISSMFGIDN
jgi:hypothetical protein